VLRSMYIAGTGMLAQKQKLDVLTNNIANIDTTGYKKDTLVSRSFQDLMIDLDDPNIVSVGLQNTGIHVDQIVTRFEQGNMEETGRLSDVALEGEGFFVVSTPEGERYTRDGAFGVSANGYLVNADGYYVSGENGNIYVGGGEFTIDESGYVTVNGATVDRLRVVTFDDLTGLRKTGNNLFLSNAGQAVPSDAKVMQGYLESSNVNMSEEAVSMIEVSRAFGINQRVLQMIDASLEKTVNEVGRV